MRPFAKACSLAQKVQEPASASPRQEKDPKSAKSNQRCAGPGRFLQLPAPQTIQQLLPRGRAEVILPVSITLSPGGQQNGIVFHFLPL